MTSKEEIAKFANEYFAQFPRCGVIRMAQDPMSFSRQRPSKERLAEDLLKNAQFRVLQLGTWLGTPDGQLIIDAVELVTPQFFGEDVALISDALILASQAQQRQGMAKAGLSSLCVLAAGALAFALVRSIST